MSKLCFQSSQTHVYITCFELEEDKIHKHYVDSVLQNNRASQPTYDLSVYTLCSSYELYCNTWKDTPKWFGSAALRDIQS